MNHFARVMLPVVEQLQGGMDLPIAITADLLEPLQIYAPPHEVTLPSGRHLWITSVFALADAVAEQTSAGRLPVHPAMEAILANSVTTAYGLTKFMTFSKEKVVEQLLVHTPFQRVDFPEPPYAVKRTIPPQHVLRAPLGTKWTPFGSIENEKLPFQVPPPLDRAQLFALRNQILGLSPPPMRFTPPPARSPKRRRSRQRVEDWPPPPDHNPNW
jgi:hypothetical protein